MSARFSAWNDALAARFFNPERADKPVYLYVTESLIEAVGGPMGGVGEFVDAMTDGPDWHTRPGLCQKALQAYRGWRQRQLAYPPYIGYLCLFSLAAGLEGEFAVHSYYPRLRQLLKLPGEGPLPSFDEMLTLWGDLEGWSTRDMSGALGVFTTRWAGEWIHVGLPVAQSILTETERNALPEIFARAGLDPTAPPPHQLIARRIAAHSADRFRRRTQAILARRDDKDETFQALLDAISDELDQWDGAVPRGNEEDSAPVPVFGSVRLCLEVDRPAGRVKARLRCRAGVEFPEEGLELECAGVGRLEAREYIPGWSTYLCDATSGAELDAINLDWSGGAVVRGVGLRWVFRWQGADIRILLTGTSEGLNGLVEVNQLKITEPGYILFRERDWPSLQEWSEKECEGFELLDIRTGLPNEWRLARIGKVLGDTLLKGASRSILAVQSVLRVSLSGGIKSGAGNSYFEFAPPDIVVDGDVNQVICDDKVLVRHAQGHFQLPSRLPVDRRIEIVVTGDGGHKRGTSLYVTHDTGWPSSFAGLALDRFGEPVEAGGLATGALPSEEGSSAVPLVDPMMAFPRVQGVQKYLVGAKAGQIAEVSEDASPVDWNPIWAIVLGAHGKATFCGTELAEPVVANRLDKRDRQLRLWKQILWTERMRIAPPQPRMLDRLWRAYQKAARDA